MTFAAVHALHANISPLKHMCQQMSVDVHCVSSWLSVLGCCSKCGLCQLLFVSATAASMLLSHVVIVLKSPLQKVWTSAMGFCSQKLVAKVATKVSNVALLMQ